MTPGQGELAQAELATADDALRAATVLMEAGFPRDAASRLYYPAFHAARAALTVRGKHAKTHTGQIALFGQMFGDAADFHRWFEVRLAADYSFAPATMGLDRLANEIASVREFIDRCRGIVAAASANGPDEPDPLPDP